MGVPTCLLLIDCQSAFITGCWAQGFGMDQISPLQQAFSRCRDLLASGILQQKRVTLVTTKCPFWSLQDRAFDPSVISYFDNVPCFIKPNNSVFEAKGWDSFMSKFVDQAAQTRLVIGGCTLTSCVRVTACDNAKVFGPRGLEVVVDISLCGARTDNYRPEGPGHWIIHEGESAVQCAIRTMRKSGVNVVDKYMWEQL